MLPDVRQRRVTLIHPKAAIVLRHISQFRSAALRSHAHHSLPRPSQRVSRRQRVIWLGMFWMHVFFCPFKGLRAPCNVLDLTKYQSCKVKIELRLINKIFLINSITKKYNRTLHSDSFNWKETNLNNFHKLFGHTSNQPWHFIYTLNMLKMGRTSIFNYQGSD